MRIESIEIHRVAMPLIYPFRTAFGDVDVIESCLVKMTSGGVTGWGEAAPWGPPLYSPEWAAGVFILVRDWLAPQLIGQDIDSGEQLQEKLRPFKGNHFAKASLDLAWWDLHAKMSQQPLWRLLGGLSDTADVGADFGVMETFDLLLQTIDKAVQVGFKRIKLKMRPGWELEVIRAVRRAFPQTLFHVDCNSGYTLEDLKLFQALDKMNLAMIEQPLAHDDLLDHAKLQQYIKTPICLDESITSPAKAAQAIEIGACRWINIKPGRVGGITPALQILRIAEKADIPCWIGGMLESAIGASHCVALATLPNIKYPSDLFPSRRFFEKDLGYPEVELSGPSEIKAFEGWGIGCSPVESQLRALSKERCCLGMS